MIEFSDFCETIKSKKTKEKEAFIKENASQIKCFLPFLSGENYNFSDASLKKIVNELNPTNQEKIYDKIQKTNGDKDLSIEDAKNLLIEFKSLNNKDKKNFVSNLISEEKFHPKVIESLFRIITKNVKLGISFEKILLQINPILAENYKKGGVLTENEIHYGAEQIVEPMLLHELSKCDFRTACNNWPEIWAERKFDGERVLLHKHKNEIKFMSRDGKNITQRVEKQNSQRSVNMKIQELCSEKDFILDCELIFLDPFTLEIVEPTGKSKKNCMYHVKVFDVIYFDDKLVTTKSLFERRQILENLRFNEHVSQSKVDIFTNDKQGHDNLKNFILSHFDKNMEGVVIKNPDSKYEIGKRSKNWLKIKKKVTFYSDSIGKLYLTTNRGILGKNETFSSFELITCDGKIVGKVSSGLTHEDLKRMNSFKYDSGNLIPDEFKEVWQIECTSFFNESRKMRHPVFKRRMENKSAISFDEYLKIADAMNETGGIDFEINIFEPEIELQEIDSDDGEPKRKKFKNF